MAQINLGRILPVWKGEWKSSVTYEKLDIVYYAGSSYISIGGAGNIGKYPDVEPTYWAKMCKEGSFEGLTEEQLTQMRQDLRVGVFEIGTKTYKD